MQKIVINTIGQYLDLSSKALERFVELTGLELYVYKVSFDDFNEYKINIGEYLPYSGISVYTKDFGNKFKLPYEKKEPYKFYTNKIKRDDPALIQVIEELKSQTNTTYCKPKIVEIPDGVKWQVVGKVVKGKEREVVEEVHRVWY